MLKSSLYYLLILSMSLSIIPIELMLYANTALIKIILIVANKDS